MFSRNEALVKWTRDLTKQLAKKASGHTLAEILKQEKKPKLKVI
ncbi:hypothetical protein SAMN05428978_11253 [Nitrosomonas sp. Nm34]|nr:hypothetical protein SAMN05428978_11253 [Nitrosomonas sp. Nm34]